MLRQNRLILTSQVVAKVYSPCHSELLSEESKVARHKDASYYEN